jgi:hypothetical protein
MDFAKMKTILEVVQGTAEGVKDFAIVWIVLEFLKIIVPYSVGIVAILCVCKLIKQVIQAIHASCDIVKIRDAMIPDQAGTSVSQGEVNRMIRNAVQIATIERERDAARDESSQRYYKIVALTESERKLQAKLDKAAELNKQQADALDKLKAELQDLKGPDVPEVPTLPETDGHHPPDNTPGN